MKLGLKKTIFVVVAAVAAVVVAVEIAVFADGATVVAASDVDSGFDGDLRAWTKPCS